MISQKFSVTRNYSYTQEIYSVYKRYSRYISKLNISGDTQNWRLKHIRGFLKYLDDNKIKIRDIDVNNVYDYMSLLEKNKDRTKEHRSICIRLFLNYLSKQKIIKFSGRMAFPKIKCNKENSIVNHYTDKEIVMIVNSVKNNTDEGKRDLAIILIFAKLGLRPRDVRNLKLENILWNENKLQITQSKTSWNLVLPIDNDLRYALLDYIKNVRPKSKLRNIFLKNENEIYSDHFFYDVVSDNIFNTDVEVGDRRHGPYIFRHSLAMSLLNNGNNLNSISNILGHTSTSTTKVYLKVDFDKLKKISLEVPEICEN